MTMAEYCQRIRIKEHTDELIQSSDPEYYQELLNTCVVIPEDHLQNIQLSYSSGSTMREVLNRLICNEIRRIGNGGNWKDQNLLSYGYRSKRWGSELEIRNTVGIECYFLNSLHSFLVTPSWEFFLNRVGEVVLGHILTRPLLIPVSNGSYVQICGQSLSYQMIDTSKTDHPMKQPQRTICRSKLFYNSRIYHSLLLSSCVFTKLDLSVSVLLEHIFKLSTYPQPESIHETLFQLCHSILNGFGQCSIWRTYQAYFERKEKKSNSQHLFQKKRERSIEDSEEEEGGGAIRKKTRRGKRGGKHQHRKVPKPNNALLPNDISQLLPKDLFFSSVLTVGERLLSHTLRNGLLDATFHRDGYESQEDSQGIVDEGLLCTTDPPPSSRKKRKRKSTRAYEKQSLDSSFSSTGNCELNLPPGDSGLRYHLEMRTMRTEHSDPQDPNLLKPSSSAPPLNFLSLCCSHETVSDFLKSVCRRVFPCQDVWGSRHNQNKFMSSLDCFLNLQRSETLSLHQLCQGYQLSHIPWLLHDPPSSGPSSISLKYQLLMDFLHWIFNEFVISLLAANFYVTEGEGTGTETLYYKKRDWRLLEEIGMLQMNSNFMKTLCGNPFNPPLASQQERGVIPFSQVSVRPTLPSQDPAPAPLSSSQSSMFIPSVRFVPKKSSMRAITNMKRSHSHPTEIPHSLRIKKTPSFSLGHLSAASTLPNSALYNCLYVLRHLSKEIDSSRGFGVDGPEEAYSILRRYLHHQAEMRNDHQDQGVGQEPGQGQDKRRHYYFAVLDLEKCFDSVDTARLYDLLLDLLDKTCSDMDKHLIHKYHVTHFIPSAERFVTRSIRNVSTEDNILSFRDAYQSLSKKFRDAVITDGVLYPKLTRTEILKLLRQHLFSHIVRMKHQTTKSSQYFTQIRGIPQGSVLSPLLCNLYYGDVENKVFHCKEGDTLGLQLNQSVIVRVVDDYIMISTRKDCVTHFLQQIHSSIAPAGGGVNPSKTKVNFNLEFEGRGERIHLSKCTDPVIQWCGLRINTITLEVMPSFNRLLDRPIQYSMNRECLQSGIALRRIMKRFLKPKCQAIVLDPLINSYPTVVRTIFQIFVVTALRIHSYMRDCSQLNRISISHNANFLTICISEAVKYGAILVRKYQWKGVDDSPSEFGTSASSLRERIFPLAESQWLGYHAFVSVFGQRKALYLSLVKVLAKMRSSVHLKKQTILLFQEILSAELDPLVSLYLSSKKVKE